MKIKYLPLLAILYGCSEKPATQQAQVQKLPVIQISTQNATTYQDYPASIEGAVNVEIRPQVSGILDKIFVDDGAYVTKGQSLFEIERAPFIEKLNNARASLRAAQGALASSQLEIDKLTPLVQNRVVSDYQLKTAESAKEVAMGSLEQAKADVATAQINLGYTLIKAPVNGYIGRVQRKQGSLVGPADPTALTDLSDVHQLHVFFALGEFDFIRFKSQYPGKKLADKLRNVPPVDLILANDSAFAKKGRIDVINGQFDNNTGAITLRAVFKNDDGLLRSGNTGKIRLGLKFGKEMIVPQSATLEMQDQTFVFLVTPGNKVTKQIITIIGKSGTNYIVKDGINPGDYIVYRGYEHLREGDAIEPEKTEAANQLANN
ncbi:efflux RND transporter periplasmic adaptor subunit [Mucilaginibacter sp.]|jgi:membrane fusion protein (multidrug efflux system)|uniref:efflux RND transporter periplasmic adaptor subunit n=1 Tax=Mucilaginibacter sp. TaxID=1882438 RepID=UPI00356818BA